MKCNKQQRKATLTAWPELQKTLVVLDQLRDLVGQLKGQRLQPGGIRAMHDHALRRLVQGSHQLLVDDHL